MSWFTVPRPRFRIVRRRVTLKGRRAEYLLHKEKTRALVTAQAAHHAQHYGVSFNKIAIRNAKSRWGSCSKKGNLNFHYKLGLLPPHLAEYVVVHEVCHLREFNHSAKFWSLVAQRVPNYRAVRKELLQLHL